MFANNTAVEVSAEQRMFYLDIVPCAHLVNTYHGDVILVERLQRFQEAVHVAHKLLASVPAQVLCSSIFKGVLRALAF